MNDLKITLAAARRRATDYDNMSLAEIVLKLETDFPEPTESDFAITPNLWHLMVMLAQLELSNR